MVAKKPKASDAKFEALLDAFEADPALRSIAIDHRRARAPGTRRSFGSNGLKVNGKLFALSVKGALVLKLPKARVDALVAAEQGERFDPGHGRLMKEWVVLRSSKLVWFDLAREALAFVGGG